MSEQTTASSSKALVTNLMAAVRPLVTDLHGRSWEEIETAVRNHMIEITEQNKGRMIDAPSRRWLLIASMILGAYHELRPLVKDEQTRLSILRNAMVAPFKERVSAYLADRFGISQGTPGEAFSRIAENFIARGEERFGRSYTYVQEVQDGTRSFINIRKCLFNDFFRANGAPEVTPICCAIDDLWAEELEKPQYGVRFDRPTTLARGDDMCRFQFTKITMKP